MNPKLRICVLLSVLFTIFLDFLNFGLVFPIFSIACIGEGAILSQNISWMSQSVIYGILISAFPLGQFFGAPLLGQLSDRHGRKPLLVISLIGAVLSMAGAGLGVHLQSFSLVLISRIIGGVMAGNLTIAYATLTDLGSGENKVRNFALVPLASGLGFAIGPYVASVLADPTRQAFFGLSLPFYFAAILSLLNIIFVQTYFVETHHERLVASSFSITESISRLLNGFKNPAIRNPLCVLLLMISANFSFVQFLSLFAVAKFELDVAGLGILYTNVGVSVALGHVLLTRTLASRFSINAILPKSLIALAVFLTLLSFSPNLLTLHILTSLVMLSCAIAYSNAMAHMSNTAPGHQQGEIMGLAVSIQCVAECMPPLILGWAASANMIFPTLLSALMAASAWTTFRRPFLQTSK